MNLFLLLYILTLLHICLASPYAFDFSLQSQNSKVEDTGSIGYIDLRLKPVGNITQLPTERSFIALESYNISGNDYLISSNSSRLMVYLSTHAYNSSMSNSFIVKIKVPTFDKQSENLAAYCIAYAPNTALHLDDCSDQSSNSQLFEYDVIDQSLQVFGTQQSISSGFIAVDENSPLPTHPLRQMVYVSAKSHTPYTSSIVWTADELQPDFPESDARPVPWNADVNPRLQNDPSLVSQLAKTASGIKFRRER